MSSCMPWVSYLLYVEGSGEVGGVSSNGRRPEERGRSAKETFLVVDEVEARGVGDCVGEEDAAVCDRLTFLEGGG